MNEMSLETLLNSIGELPSFEAIKPLTVTSRNSVKETPLHVAAIWGDVGAIRLLVEAGADIDAAGEHGHTPLQEAVGQHKIEAVKVLLELGADASIKNEWGETAEEIATLLCRWDVAKAIQERSPGNQTKV
jgi:ankyrin repeat protein